MFFWFILNYFVLMLFAFDDDDDDEGICRARS